MLAAALKKRVRDGQLTYGPMLTYDFWPGHLEVFKAEGMHYAVLDLEHGAASLKEVEELCRTARLLHFPLIVRPEGSIFHLVRKYLDMGASGFLLPWTETMSQLETARDAIFTPPRGRRGPGGPSTLWNKSFHREGWDEVESSLFIMPQIESPAGVKAVPQLASPDWVDATMLGPYDLALNMDRCWKPEDPDLVNAIESIHRDSAQQGKACGMVANSPEQARFWIERGFRFFIYSEIRHMVAAQARELVQRMEENWANRPQGAEK
jgi:2-keto-3-deoxy-L-rhamnonate aldolase RhmA